MGQASGIGCCRNRNEARYHIDFLLGYLPARLEIKNRSHRSSNPRLMLHEKSVSELNQFVDPDLRYKAWLTDYSHSDLRFVEARIARRISEIRYRLPATTIGPPRDS